MPLKAYSLDLFSVQFCRNIVDQFLISSRFFNKKSNFTKRWLRGNHFVQKD